MVVERLEQHRGSRWAHWLRGLLWLVPLVVVLAASLVGRWGIEDWRFDLFSHFPMHYFVVSLILAIGLLCNRRWLLFLLAAGLTVYNGLLIFSIPVRDNRLLIGPTFTAMSVNVHTANNQPERTLALIRRENPDFIGFTELTGNWQEVLEALRESHPYQEITLHTDAFGFGLVSRYPFVGKDPRFPGIGSMHREVETPAGRLGLLMVHPVSPTTEGKWGWRNRTLARIAEFVSELDHPVLLMGDLNTSPWSPFYQKLVEDSGLRPPAVRVLPRRTWPCGQPLLWIPIDHFLLSPELVAFRDWVGPCVGSDHYPIFLTFGMAAGGQG